MLKSAFSSPKIRMLAARLGIPFPHAVGICGMLWNFTADHAPQGDIGKHDDWQIATAVEWAGEPSALVAALVACRLLDAHPSYRLLIHDWAEHCPRYVHGNLSRKGLAVIDLKSSPTTERTTERTAVATTVGSTVRTTSTSSSTATSTSTSSDTYPAPVFDNQSIREQVELELAKHRPPNSNLTYMLTRDPLIVALWNAIPKGWAKERSKNLPKLAAAVTLLADEQGIERSEAAAQIRQAITGYTTSDEGKGKFSRSLTRWLDTEAWREDPASWKGKAEEDAKAKRAREIDEAWGITSKEQS